MPISQPEITAADLLTALMEATARDDPQAGLTTAEICERTGWPQKRTLARLNELRRAGRLEVVTVLRESLDGRQTARPAYRLRGD